MSLAFNDTTTRKGIVQHYEKEIGANFGDVSGNTSKLKDFTADCNSAHDRFVELAIKSSGTWQFDDSNHTKYPTISTNIVSTQRDYTFTTDEQGNIILDIYAVWVADESGVFHKLEPVDKQNQVDMDTFENGQNQTGMPTRYDKTANGILLDLIPSYSYTNGLKVEINREGSYFVYTDTTKMPGVPGLFHEYYALRPAFDYARRKNLSILPRLEKEVVKMEGDVVAGVTGTIEMYFSRRPKDERPRLSVIQQNNR